MASCLPLLQLVSPALPVGAFSYSEGLEVLVQQGVVGDSASLQQWLAAELSQGALSLEVAALKRLGGQLQAWNEDPLGPHGSQLRDLDGWLLALREAPELRAQQLQMGGSLLRLLADLGWPLPDGCLDLGWPAAWAWAGQALGVSAPELQQGYLYSWVANQLSAALRLLSLGPTQAQRLQLQLAPLISERALALAEADPQQLWMAGVGAGLAQLQHSSLYSRLFRS